MEQDQQLIFKIERFWQWFRQNEHIFRDVTDARAAREAMDEQILEFGFFSWEIGEGGDKPHYLTISPNGDKRRLGLSRRIVEAAPALREWQFYYCKPPKDWDFKFEMYDRYMLRQQYDASGWQFALLGRPGNQIEIILQAGNLEGLDLDDGLDAGDFAITQLLGEELIIEYLAAFELVAAFGPDAPAERYRMPELKYRFEKMLSS